MTLTKNHKIIIGVGLMGVCGYFLWKKFNPAKPASAPAQGATASFSNWSGDIDDKMVKHPDVQSGKAIRPLIKG